MNGAPAAVVEKERKKKADAEAKIAVIEQQLAGLRKWLFNYKKGIGLHQVLTKSDFFVFNTNYQAVP